MLQRSHFASCGINILKPEYPPRLIGRNAHSTANASLERSTPTLHIHHLLLYSLGGEAVSILSPIMPRQSWSRTHSCSSHQEYQ